MSIKVTESEFLEALEEHGDLTHSQLAIKLGLTQQSVSARIKRLDIRDHAVEYAKTKTVSVLRHLFEQSKSGVTAASKILLEIAEVYTPGAKIDFSDDIKKFLNMSDEDYKEMAGPAINKEPLKLVAKTKRTEAL